MAKRINSLAYQVGPKGKLQWRVCVPQMLKEIVNSNDQMSIFRQPFSILQGLLAELGERASEINDPELNALMVRLSIYAIGDPYSEGYEGPDRAQEVIDQGLKAKQKRLRNGKV